MTLRLIRLLSWACLLALVAGCGRDPAAEVAQLREDAQAFADAGHLKAAIASYKALLRHQPDDAPARFELGRVYLRAHQPKAALKELERAERLGAQSKQLAKSLIETRLALGQYHEALAEIGRARTLAPDEAESYVAEARAQLALGETAAAEAALAEARKREPDAPEVRLSLAELALSQHDVAGAAAHLDAALAADPLDAKALAARARLHGLAGDYAAAEALWQRAAEQDPHSAVATTGLIEAKLMQNELAEAKPLLEILKRQLTARHPQYQFARALLSAQEGHHQEAIDALLLVLKQTPNHLQSQAVLGDLYLKTGQEQQAFELLSTVNRRAPGSRPVAMRLATLLLKRGDFAGARRALAANADAPDLDANYLGMLSYAAFASGDADAGQEWLARAAEVGPDTPVVQRMRGLIRLVRGEAPAADDAAVPADDSLALMTAYAALRDADLGRARAVVDTLVARTPQAAAVRHVEGLVLLAEERPDEAARRFADALAADPDFVPSLMSSAELAARNGDLATAAQRLRHVLDVFPVHLRAHLALAQLALTEGDRAQARSWLEQAAEHHPKAAGPRLLLGQLLLDLRKPAEATRWLDEAERLAPDVTGITQLRAAAELQAGDAEAAERLFRELLEAAPADRGRQRDHAIALGHVGKIDEARSRLQQLLEDDPADAASLRALARVETQAQNATAAIELVDRLVAAHPTDPASHLFRGDVLRAHGRPRDAAAAFAEAARHEAGAIAVTRQAEALIDASAPTEARAALEHWLENQPDDVAVRGKLAEVELVAGNRERVIELYQGLLADVPDHVQALNNLAYLLGEHDAKQAVAYAERAYELAPDQASVADTLGWLLVQQGSARRGAQLLEKAVALDPAQPVIRYHHAYALAQAGDERAARKALTELLAANEDFPLVDDAKALLRRLEREGKDRLL